METKFWEFSLFFPRELFSYFSELKSNLKNKFILEKNCVSISFCNENVDDKYVFLIAVTEDVYKKNILYIKSQIAKIILLYYKPKTILSVIKNFDLINHDNVILLDILSNFDATDDINYILSNLSLCDKMYLDSFVCFKLKYLKKRWKEIGGLINENSHFLMDTAIKNELMQFLMDGIETGVEFVKLSSNGSKIYIQSTEKLECNNIYYSKLDYDDLLFTIISNKPKKLEVECYKNFNVNFINELSILFGNKLILKE